MDSAVKKDYLFSNKQLFKLILPLVLEQLLTILVGMADTINVTKSKSCKPTRKRRTGNCAGYVINKKLLEK